MQKERVFETAFIEYGSMESMTAPTGRKMFFLTDPIEDWPRDWADYRRNYQATFTAQLLYPGIADYEIMPWPERVYEGLYNVSAGSEEKARIPTAYATQMHIMVNTLHQMPLSTNKVTGAEGISVLIGNSLMFQRFPTHEGYDDPQLSNFYGNVLPLLKRGIPVKTVHMENLPHPATLNDTRILLMTYSNMKPMVKDTHDYLEQWVKEGGILIYSGRDDDPFQSVSEWWNSDGLHYPTASAHLFEKLGLEAAPAEGEYRVGQGTVCILRQDPKEYVLHAGRDDQLISTVRHLYEEVAKAGTLEMKNSFHLTRGNYELIAVMDEGITNEPFTMEGLFIDLYDPQLPVISSKTVPPGSQSLLFNIASMSEKNDPAVLATAARVYDEKRTKNSYSFIAKSPIESANVMRVLLPDAPVECSILNNHGEPVTESNWRWDTASRTVLIEFENHPEGISVYIKY